MLFIFAIVITIVVCYLLTLQRALSRVGPSRRLMEPAYVWLDLIPCFNIIWGFIMVSRVSDSLKNEFAYRRAGDGGDCAKGLGTTSQVLLLCGFIPVIGGLFSIAGLICICIYWTKIAGYSAQLLQPIDSDRDRWDDDDQYEDDYTRRRDRFAKEGDEWGESKRRGEEEW